MQKGVCEQNLTNHRVKKSEEEEEDVRLGERETQSGDSGVPGAISEGQHGQPALAV